MENIIPTAIKALFGALGSGVMSLFWKPTILLMRFGEYWTGFIMAMCGMIFSIALTSLITGFLQLEETHTNIMAVSFGAGVVSVFLLLLVANFFKENEYKDIVDVAREIRE